ncbi:MAG: protein kinase [candidate division WS1 bacterium]|jgi:serine/threonine-protein kinase|nr:protein kinase [candidate division WS1 bacterium]
MPDNTHGDETVRVGPYAVQDVIGSGPHGTVYAVLDEEKHQRLALKRLHEPVKGSLGDAFSRIARVVVAMTHPTICNVRHIVLAGKHVAIVEEVAGGRSLAEVLEHDGLLDPQEVLSIARQLCAGLQYAHQRCVYHTSLRPENVFLMPDGGVLITDFAIAALYANSTRKRPRYSAGHELSFAPEFRNGGIINPLSDIYSLGVLLFIALAGVPDATPAAGVGRFSYLEVGGVALASEGLPPLEIDLLPAATPAGLRGAIAAAISDEADRRPLSVNAFGDMIRGDRARRSMPARAIGHGPDVAPTAAGPRVRVCTACRRPVSPAGRVCLACGLVQSEGPEADEMQEYYHKHARRLLAQGDLRAAESAYRRAISRDPQSAALHNELGDLLAVGNRFTEAVASYKKGLRLDAEDDDAWHDLGVSLAALQRRREAREALERAARLTERDEVRLSARLHLGAIAADEGRTDEALRLWRSVLDEDPGLIPVRMAMASSLAAMRDFEGAEEQLRAVLSIEPGLLEAQNLLARVGERSQLERADADHSFGLTGDLGGGSTYIGPGFGWVRFR